jgi:hypothetical protein
MVRATLSIVLLSLGCWFSSPALSAAAPIQPLLELQSEALTPPLPLVESKKPVHQVRLLADVGRPGISRGTLVLDPNTPAFDEFGELAGGIVTPAVRSKPGRLPSVNIACQIEPVQTPGGQHDWHLYRLVSAELKTPLHISTRGPITNSGPARLLVLDKDDRVELVIPLTRYGVVEP